MVIYVQTWPQTVIIGTNHAYIWMLADKHTDTLDIGTGDAYFWMSADEL